MEVFGVGVGMALLVSLLIVVAISLAFPLFWLWMLVDAILRLDSEFPSGSSNEKLLWIVLMVVVQIAAIAYWVMVYRAHPRRSTRAVVEA